MHFVDVAARRALAGVSLLWIVECKLWSKRIPMEKVAALKAVVDSAGADRGLLMSERGFQSGAVRMVRQKNITLSSLADLRANASEEILGARFAAAEKRLVNLSLRVTRDLRPSALQFPRMLVALAGRLEPADVAEFAACPSATDLMEGLNEITSQISDLTSGYFEEFLTHPEQLELQWRPGTDDDVMEGVEAAIHTLRMRCTKEGWATGPHSRRQWTGRSKLAWSMQRLIKSGRAKSGDA